jgi:hypothetical protein
VGIERTAEHRRDGRPDRPDPLPVATEPPANFPDLADIEGTFLATGGEFLVAELDGHLVVTGG